MGLTNNDILKKLRVALELRDTDIVKILELVDFRISKSELGAFFRKEGHPKYMELQDQILRNFLNGLVVYKRGPRDSRSAKENFKKDNSPKVVNPRGDVKKHYTNKEKSAPKFAKLDKNKDGGKSDIVGNSMIS
ncbi:MAG: DUF1456 family protein [Saprospiraceae bacterium]